jgi:hypothetical protein
MAPGTRALARGVDLIEVVGLPLRGGFARRGTRCRPPRSGQLDLGVERARTQPGRGAEAAQPIRRLLERKPLAGHRRAGGSDQLQALDFPPAESEIRRDLEPGGRRIGLLRERRHGGHIDRRGGLLPEQADSLRRSHGQREADGQRLGEGGPDRPEPLQEGGGAPGTFAVAQPLPQRRLLPRGEATQPRRTLSPARNSTFAGAWMPAAVTTAPSSFAEAVRVERETFASFPGPPV